MATAAPCAATTWAAVAVALALALAWPSPARGSWSQATTCAQTGAAAAAAAFQRCQGSNSTGAGADVPGSSTGGTGGTAAAAAAAAKTFRDYDKAATTVSDSYLEQRVSQTYEFARRATDKYCDFAGNDTFWDLFDKSVFRAVRFGLRPLH